MYRFLLTPRWIAMALLVVVLIPIMVRLGFWQFHRHENKVAHNDLISDNRKREPAPAAEILTVGAKLSAKSQWRQVTATGRYDSEHQVLVRQRSQNDVVGYYVVVPLITTDGRALLVNRGWVANAATAEDVPDVPATPTGQVTVTGRLRPDETRENSGIGDRPVPQGQVLRISGFELAPKLKLPYPVFGGYIELTEQTPAPAKVPAAVPAPDDEDLGPHLAYAVQWWIFAFALLAMYVRLIRTEARDLESELAALDAAAAEDEHEEPAKV
ncbi:SURF1 family protein [Embleya sp. NBC_00896]|uniref:SURF1 family cytochrome oxidase biogenesis protein n=1 Tax=Embleya sp. NBC_00896 TaxID=2975961 RepID=UPI0038654ECA|nr:SURF1 family protein [Embleya sp. NBC_00896]